MSDSPLPSNLVPEWQSFLSEERTLDDLFNHGTLFPLQRKREMKAMMEEARATNPRVLMCIGTDKGGDVWAFLNECPAIETVVAIEFRGVPWIPVFEEHFPDVEFFGIHGSSYGFDNIVKVYKFLRGREIDVLFLDGDKGAFDKDYAAYSPCVRTGGVVLVHDVNPVHGTEGPHLFFEAIKQERPALCRAIVDTTEVDEELALAESGRPTQTAHADWVRYWKRSSCGVGVVHL